jgi:hypothetical protein
VAESEVDVIEKLFPRINFKFNVTYKRHKTQKGLMFIFPLDAAIGIPGLLVKGKDF